MNDYTAVQDTMDLVEEVRKGKLNSYINLQAHLRDKQEERNRERELADTLGRALEDCPCRCYWRWEGDPPVERRRECLRCAALRQWREARGGPPEG